MNYYILLRPETDKEKKSGFRTGYLMKYPLLDNLKLVNSDRKPFAYEKISDKRKNLSLTMFKAELEFSNTYIKE